MPGISSGRLRPASARTLPRPTSVRPAPQRQVSARVANMFLTPADSIDAVEFPPVQLSSHPYEYAPGYNLFKVKRAKPPELNVDASVEAIREEEFTSSHKTGTQHMCIYTSNLAASIDFYVNGLGLRQSSWRPELPYQGAWITVPALGYGTTGIIHLIQLANPHADAMTDEDDSCIAHFSIGIQQGTLKEFLERMDSYGLKYYRSTHDRKAVVVSDPNGYRLEAIELPPLEKPVKKEDPKASHGSKGKKGKKGNEAAH